MRGTLSGVVSGALGLIVLQLVTTQAGSTATGGVLNWANSVVRRALDPNVPAIPDLRKPGGANAAGGVTPDYSKPYLPPTAVIPDPRQVPVNGQTPMN